MSREIDERPSTQPGSSTDHLENALDEIYQFRQQAVASPEATPINTSEATRQVINQVWQQVGEPLLKTVNDTIQQPETGSERQDKPSSPWRDVDIKACNQAYDTFGLGNYDLPRSLVPGLIGNELRHYDPLDSLDDLSVRLVGTVRNFDGSVKEHASIGPAQIQIQNINRLAEEYPELQHFGNPLQAALEPAKAPFFVAAYMRDSITAIENYNNAHPEQNERIPINADTLAYCYNNDVLSRRETDGHMEYKYTSLGDMVDPENRVGWHSEPLPINQDILMHSKHVKNVHEAMQRVEQISF